GGEDRVVYGAGLKVAGRYGVAILQRGNACQRNRLEGAVRIVGEVGVQFLDLVGVLDRAPELELDFGRRGRGRGRRVRRFRGRAGGPGGVERDRADQVGVAPGQLALRGLLVGSGSAL